MELQIYRTIDEVNLKDWNDAFEGIGIFDVKGLQFLEKLFLNQTEPVYQWKFYYICIYEKDTPVLLTFLTSAIWKLDIFSPTWVSESIEMIRSKTSPLLFSERILTLGSLLTEGNHLYVNYKEDWKFALKLLITHLETIRKETQSEYLFFRDMPAKLEDVNSELIKNNFIKDSVVMERAILKGKDLTFDQWKQQHTRSFRLKVINRINNLIDKKYKRYNYNLENQETDAEFIDKVEREINHFIERKKVVNLYPMPAGFVKTWVACGFDIVAILDHDDTIIGTVIYRKIINKQSYLYFLGFNDKYQEEFNVCYMCYLIATQAAFESDHKDNIHFGLEKNVEKSRMGCTFDDHYCFVKINKLALLKHLAKLGMLYCCAIIAYPFSILKRLRKQSNP